MSVLTEVLKLFKYDPSTDGDMTFNIGQCMNDNWDKLDAAILLAIAAAGAYNPEESYAVGDYCTYKGKLHKCSTAIPTGETWTEAHWTTTTVAAEMQELSSQLSNALMKSSAIYHKLNGDSNLQLSNGADLNLLPNGIAYTTSGSATSSLLHLPPGITATSAVIITESGNGVSDQSHYRIQTMRIRHNNQIYVRFSGDPLEDGSENWYDWVKIPLCQSPQKFTAPLSDGYSGTLTYLKTQENIVIMNFDVYKTDNSAINGVNLISTLPEGFRGSSGYCAALATGVGGGSIVGAAQAWCDVEGIIRTLCPSGTYRIRGEITFCAN